MGAVGVVAFFELAQRVQQVAVVPDQRAVEQFLAAGLYPALHDGVHARRPYSAEHDLDVSVLQDFPDRGRGSLDPEGGQLALDPAVSPTRVLAQQTQEESADRRYGARAARAAQRPICWLKPGPRRAELPLRHTDLVPQSEYLGVGGLTSEY